MKRIDDMMNRARARVPFAVKDHEKRVKDIRSGKFKI